MHTQQPTLLSKLTTQEFRSWVKITFTDGYQREIESYLADSVDHADLENRIKTLQRRGMI